MPHDFLPQQEATQTSSEVVQEIIRAICQLRQGSGYGSVEITVHEGKVTQIERREKVRFNQTSVQSTHKDKPTVSAVANS